MECGDSLIEALADLNLYKAAPGMGGENSEDWFAACAELAAEQERKAYDVAIFDE